MEFGYTQWRKSSFSTETADCIEVSYPDWRKSSFSSETEACVEVANPAAGSTVGIRDSKNPGGGQLSLPHTALHHLIQGLGRLK